MKGRSDKPTVLIVNGYHPKEVFAIKIGEALIKDGLASEVKIVRYAGKQDEGQSNRNLRRFVEKFNPVISPIVLHSDSNLGVDIVIYYVIKSAKGRRRLLKLLANFSLTQNNGLVCWGAYLVAGAKRNLIEIELNPKTDPKIATQLTKDFIRYLLNLYTDKKIKL